MTQRVKRRRLSYEKRHNLSGYLFTLPFIIGFFAFFAYPMVYSLVLSFSNVVSGPEGLSTSLAGLVNYRHALLVDVDLIPMLLRTVVGTAVNLPVVLAFSLFLAKIINRKSVFRPFFAAAFFLPLIIGSGVVMETILGQNMDSQALGYVGANNSEQTSIIALQGIQMSSRLWDFFGPELSESIQTVLDYISNSLWTSGIQTIIFLGALQSVPESYYEASYCDGATEWEKFWLITLPLITPTILLNTVYSLIDSFMRSDNEIMKYTLKLINDIRLGYGSAVSWIYFLMIGLLIGLIFLLFRRRVYHAN